MPFPKNRPPTTGSYGPAGFGVQYNGTPKKKKYTGPDIPNAVTKRYGIDNFKPTIEDKLKKAVSKPAAASPVTQAVQPRPDRQTFKRPTPTIPSRNVGPVVPKKRKPVGPINRPGPVDDVVGPNRPPSRSGSDTPDYTLTVKLGSIQRRLQKGPVVNKRVKRNRRKYGGM